MIKKLAWLRKLLKKMDNIEHIGIAVSDLDEANKVYTKLLGTKPYKQEHVKTEGVITSFFKTEWRQIR